MSSYSEDHISNLAILNENLKKKKLSIFESSYNHLIFGSFILIVGTSKKRSKFVYDGKEGWLTISQSEFSNTNSPAQWNEIEQKPIERSLLFPEIEKRSLELI